MLSPEKAVAFAAVHQAVWGIYMGSTFAPNHKGMPIIAAADNLDFLRRQVLTSRNVRGGWFTDFALGGLNYQIEHHLFPSMPRGSLRHAQPIVRALLRGARGALLRDVPARLVPRGAGPSARDGCPAARREQARRDSPGALSRGCLRRPASDAAVTLVFDGVE